MADVLFRALKLGRKIAILSVMKEKEKEKMKKLIRKLFTPTPSRKALEIDYLNHSVSIHDLECRQREIAKGLFH